MEGGGSTSSHGDKVLGHVGAGMGHCPSTQGLCQGPHICHCRRGTGQGRAQHQAGVRREKDGGPWYRPHPSGVAGWDIPEEPRRNSVPKPGLMTRKRSQPRALGFRGEGAERAALATEVLVGRDKAALIRQVSHSASLGDFQQAGSVGFGAALDVVCTQHSSREGPGRGCTTTGNTEPATDNSDPLTDNSNPLTDNTEPLTDNSDPLTSNTEPMTDNTEPPTDNRDPLTNNSEPPTSLPPRAGIHPHKS